MKKIFVVVVISLFVLALSSCKSHDCPAYSQADTTQVEINS